jgi:uncharacterized protein (TIRG00374 family)
VFSWLKRHRTRVLLWSRLLIAMSLMGLVLALVARDRDQLAHVNWGWVPFAWVLLLVSTVVKALRWSLLVRQSRMNVSFRRLLGTYLVGAFFSTVLPTSFGGDAVRAVDTAARTGRAADSTSSVLIERGIGLLAVIGGGSMFALLLEPGKVPHGFILVVHALFVAGIAGLLILREGWFLGPIAALLTRLHLGSLVLKVRSLQTALTDHLKRPGILLLMLLLSIIANALSMGAIYLVLCAVTQPIPLAAFVPMIALSTVAELLPISIAALGVKESAYIFFLGLAGVGHSEAGVIAIIMRVLTWGLALLGGLVFLLRTLHSSPDERQRPITAR